MRTNFVPTRLSLPSRRSVVMSPGGMVAASNPLAAEAGLQILRRGGNAVDAAIAVAGVLCVVEPMSTGIGGDAFSLVWWADEGRLYALNGSGRAPEKADCEYFASRGYSEMPDNGILTVTVPGAVDAWCTLVDRFGTRALSDLLEPAIMYADEGFPVAETIAPAWSRGEELLCQQQEARRTLLTDRGAPQAGERFRLPDLARTLELIAAEGRDVFYRGSLARRIATFCAEYGGLLTADDLAGHHGTWDEPISTDYRGYEVYECPPNGQGLAALLALNLVEGFELSSMRHNSAEHLHIIIEAMKLALADALQYVADPEHVDIPIEELLSKEYAERRRRKIRDDAATELEAGNPHYSDTVYFTVVDEDRNCVSFINSLYSSFGSGVVVPGTGILLQCRGKGFSLNPDHPNRLAPGKRPFHTIIPSMIFRDGAPVWTYGVMGGGMQPQGHLQVVSNLIDFQMNVQESMDAPRFRHLEANRVGLEPIDPGDHARLAQMGHEILSPDEMVLGFGGGQIIQIDETSGFLYGGSDPRKDGHAVGY